MEELSGNVWEYCLNKYYRPDALRSLHGYDWRAARGGSCCTNAEGTSVAARLFDIGLNGADGLGFRVVCALISGALSF